jgi:exopolysaccharide biosynthesis polyprenyl glycosylphosphotransferase
MSSPVFHPRQQKPRGTVWAARLIPGSSSGSHRRKQGPRALRDYLLVTLNWVLVAEISLRLHGVFPHMPMFSGSLLTSSISPTLLGIALLHGTLINLVSGPDGLRAEDTDLRTQMRTVGKAVFWATLVLSAALQLQGLSALAAALVWSAGILHFGTLLGRRWAEREGQLRGVRAMRGTRNVLIVGASELGRRIANYLDEHPEMDRSVSGFLDDRKPLGNGVVGRTSDLAELARTGFVDEVILAAPHDRDLTLRVLHLARQLRLDVKMAPDLFGCEPARESQRIGSIPLISLHEEELPVGGLLTKRVLDVAAAGTALILTAPALALIAILIKLGSPGPVLYTAPRAGRKGKPFRCYKFRTMVRDADDLKEKLRKRNQRSGPFFKITRDPRITRIGRFLRRYSLDELPQLLNVLKGEMSLVGPRPHPLDDVSEYAIEHLPRLDVIPGMTGLWQVTARRDPSFQTGMNLDIEYIHCWSLRMDMRILLKTAGAVLRGSGD